MRGGGRGFIAKSYTTNGKMVSSVAVKPEFVFPLSSFQALDLTLARDERLAVGFFQRSAVMMQIDRHKAAHNQSPLFFCFTLICVSLILVHFCVCPSLQIRRSSLRLYLGAEAYARKCSHWLQAAGPSIQTEQLAGQNYHHKHHILLHCCALYQECKEKKTCNAGQMSRAPASKQWLIDNVRGRATHQSVIDWHSSRTTLHTCAPSCFKVNQEIPYWPENRMVFFALN